MDRSNVNAPISPEMQVWIEERFRWLGEQFGWYRLRNQQTLLLTTEFFPATIKTLDDIQGIFKSLCRHMSVPKDSCELRIHAYDPSGRSLLGVPELGFAGQYHENQAKAIIDLIVRPDDKPVTVVATLAHELGHARLLRENRITVDEPDHEPLTDLLTVYLGLGVFNGNATIQESHLSDGQNTYWRAGKLGYLQMADYSYALALYAMEREEERPVWLSHLRPDLQQLFRQSRKALLSLGVSKISERTGTLGPFVYPVAPVTTASVQEVVDPADEFTEEDFLNAESAYSPANLSKPDHLGDWVMRIVIGGVVVAFIAVIASAFKK